MPFMAPHIATAIAPIVSVSPPMLAHMMAAFWRLCRTKPQQAQPTQTRLSSSLFRGPHKSSVNILQDHEYCRRRPALIQNDV